eukprot:gene7562-8848_t
MGTGGTTLASAVTYYILVQVSETNAFRGNSGKEKDEFEDWVVLDKMEVSSDDISKEKMEQVEEYLSTIDLDSANASVNEQEMAQDLDPAAIEEIINREIQEVMDEFVMM